MICPALLLALSLAAAPAPPPGIDARTAARTAIELLADEDVEGAREALLPFAGVEATDPAMALAQGVLRFQEQRYDEAVALLERAAAAGAGGDWLAQRPPDPIKQMKEHLITPSRLSRGQAEAELLVRARR